MPLITWGHSLEVGVKEIDTQHEKLVQLINGLHDHMLAGDAGDIMGKVLDRVIEYTGFHFGTEERLMGQHAYPGAQAHKSEHQKLVRTALDLQTKVKSGQTHITMETMKFLKDWLQHHIMESDKSFASHLKSKGVS